MEWLTLAGLAVGLAMDATAVAAAAGLAVSPFRWAPGVRLAFHFGLFQALFPVAGWLAGKTLQRLIASYDHWVAFLLLAVVGGRMILEGFRPREAQEGSDPSRGLHLLALSTAVSIDALAVGLGLAMLEDPVLVPALVIGLVTGFLSLLGYALGAKIGAAGGGRLKIAGGVILLAIGLRILYVHLAAR